LFSDAGRRDPRLSRAAGAARGPRPRLHPRRRDRRLAGRPAAAVRPAAAAAGPADPGSAGPGNPGGPDGVRAPPPRRRRASPTSPGGAPVGDDGPGLGRVGPAEPGGAGAHARGGRGAFPGGAGGGPRGDRPQVPPVPLPARPAGTAVAEVEARARHPRCGRGGGGIRPRQARAGAVRLHVCGPRRAGPGDDREGLLGADRRRDRPPDGVVPRPHRGGSRPRADGGAPDRARGRVRQDHGERAAFFVARSRGAASPAGGTPALPGQGADPPAAASLVDVIRLNGVIAPATGRYVVRGIRDAERDRADALLIEMDTPGGLLKSMDDITRAMINTEMPTVVYVYPSGSRAASAGV